MANEFFVFTFKSTKDSGTFTYIRNENFQQVDGYSCSFDYTVEECEEGYKIILSEKSILDITQCSRINKVYSLTLLNDFRTIVSVMEMNDTPDTKTEIAHYRVRA